MLEEKMSEGAERLLQKLNQMMLGSADGFGKAALLGVQYGIEISKDKVSIEIDPDEVKEYELAFKEAGLKYKSEFIGSNEKILFTFDRTEAEAFKKALEIVEVGRSKVNEKNYDSFVVDHEGEAISKIEPLDGVHIDRFREYANQGLIDYAIFKTEDGKLGVAYKDSEEVEVKNILNKTHKDFLGRGGEVEKSKVEMQLAAVKVAEEELNKYGTDFVIVDAGSPESHTIVSDETWIKYMGAEEVGSFDLKNKTPIQHKQEIIRAVQTMKSPLIMSKEEYSSPQMREELIKKSGYLQEFFGPEQKDYTKEAEEKTGKLKSTKLTKEDKDKSKKKLKSREEDLDVKGAKNKKKTKKHERDKRDKERGDSR